jgi:DNA helicase MCM8
MDPFHGDDGIVIQGPIGPGSNAAAAAAAGPGPVPQHVQRAMRNVSTFDQDEVTAWSTYFPNDICRAGDVKIQIIRELSTFFREHADFLLDIDDIKDKSRAMLDYQYLIQHIPVSEFGEMLKQQPTLVNACLSIAVHHALLAMRVSFHIDKIHVRLQNYQPLTGMRKLKANLVDHFIAIHGNVVRVSAIKPMVVSMFFDCTRCGNRIFRTFPDGRYSPPPFCEGRCKNKIFAPDRSSARTIDWQVMRIQEIVSTDQQDQGRIPRTIECEVTDDLVDCCIPGDAVTLVGTVKARRTDVPGGRGKKQSLFMLYLDVNNVENGNENENGKLDIMQFGTKDMYAIVEIAQQPNVFKFLVHSLCPSIYGNELVKAGLLLSLFGGRQKHGAQKEKIAIRGDPHLLVVGDPGLGKSQMLRATSAAAPRGVYVCGNTTSTSGLTVTMVRDGKAAGDYALEAGALVLADQGVCCIDEFDKMSADHNALLEAMEQQSISIAKAGIVCSLSARSSVIAAANPIGGHYDRSKTVAENLKMGSALLSRFDLIFILLDRPDEDRDHLLSEHVLALHSGSHRAGAAASRNGGLQFSQGFVGNGRSLTAAAPDPSQSFENAAAAAAASNLTPQEWTEARPLQQRLAMSAAEQKALDPLPPHLLRKYIAYARKYVEPKLTRGAKEVLKAFYLKLRKDHHNADSTPITTRQLESMVRLAEARAKCELREAVTAQDALDVVDIMKESLYDIFTDELGQVDFSRSTGMSKSKQVSSFVKALHHHASRQESALFTTRQLRDIAAELRLGVERFDDFIDALNDQNYLLKRGNGRYVLQSSSFSQYSQ